MRFRLPRLLRRKIRMTKADARMLGMINKDKPRFDRMRMALRDGHKPSASELNAYHRSVEEFEKKSLDAGKANDEFGERYYKGLAKMLNEEVAKALQGEYQKLIPKY